MRGYQIGKKKSLNKNLVHSYFTEYLKAPQHFTARSKNDQEETVMIFAGNFRGNFVKKWMQAK